MAASRPYRPFKAAKPAKSLFSAPLPVAPPSERVVSAVLQFGDLREDRQDGLTAVRFTPERLEREDMALLLGDECARAADVSILWDEEEGQMVRVIDVAPLRAGRAGVDQANRYAAARKRSLRPVDPRYSAAA